MVKSLNSWGGVNVMFNNAGIIYTCDDNVISTLKGIWDFT